jgi:hypothetical protein
MKAALMNGVDPTPVPRLSRGVRRKSIMAEMRLAGRAGVESAQGPADATGGLGAGDGRRAIDSAGAA